MMPENAVDGQLLIDALADQRNRSQNDAAAAVARWVMSQKKCAELTAKVAELEARLADVEGLEKHLEELKKVPKPEAKKKEPTNARTH